MRQNILKPRVFVEAILSILFFCPLATGQAQLQWHTTPDKWKEPRTFHTECRVACADRIQISHVKLSDNFKVKVLSPNRAYWFAVNPNDGGERLAQEKGGRFHASTPDVPVYIFNERPQLIKITLKYHYPNFILDVRWINEKLLYIEAWWGRVIGSYFIFDIEKEAVIHKEMVHDGGIPFRQWQPSRQR